jgi:anti-anti-sigma factor
MTNLRDVVSDAFRTSSTEQGTTCVVKLDGCLDMETTALFVQFLTALAPTLKTQRWLEVVFDCKTLYLMSSSAISTLATWVTGLQQARATCKLTFHTDPNLKWQARTLDGIRRLGPSQISVVNE